MAIDVLSYDDIPDKTIYFKEINPCGFLCTGNHPFSTVERFDIGIIVEAVTRRPVFIRQERNGNFFTRDRELAIKTAKSHIE